VAAQPVPARDKDNQRLLMLIRDSYSLSGGVYGYRRVHGDLNEIGETCGKNRVGHIMQLNRKAVRGYKAPRRIAGRPSVVAPNRVQRQFTVVRANQVWVTDITYSVPGVQGGHGCLNEPRVCLEY
jgi:putative transposase